MVQTDHTIPAWVYSQSGQLVPFDSDRISADLFKATERLGRPDPFLSRELSQSVLHFIAEEGFRTPPTTGRIKEIVATVVRELGHPLLARQFESEWPTPQELDRVSNSDHVKPHAFRNTVAGNVEVLLQQHGLHTVFGPDIAAAHEQGLLTILGLSSPTKVFASLLPDIRPRIGEYSGLVAAHAAMLDAIDEAAQVAGCTAVWDSPEYAVAACPERDARGNLLLQNVFGAMQRSGLSLIVHLNCRMPPTWTEPGSQGPLFAEPPQIPAHELDLIREQILAELAKHQSHQPVCLAWHLTPSDIEGSTRNLHRKLEIMAKLIIDWGQLTIQFDRRKKQMSLGLGIDREHPAALIVVAIHLPQLVQLPGIEKKPELFLKKCTNLVRLAISAACYKRAYLQKLPSNDPGEGLTLARRFLLARARVVVVPAGLDFTVRQLVNMGIAEGDKGCEYAKRVLHVLQTVLSAEADAKGLSAFLGGYHHVWQNDPTLRGLNRHHEDGIEGKDTLGFGPWDRSIPLRKQLNVADALQRNMDSRAFTFTVALDGMNPETVKDVLRYAWKETTLNSLVFRKLSSQRQPTLPGYDVDE